MATAVHTRRAMLCAIGSVAFAAALPASVAASAPASDEFAKAWAALEPLQRKFVYDQMYARVTGEPNILDKTAEYTFDEWLSDIPQWERDMITRVFQSPDIRAY